MNESHVCGIPRDTGYSNVCHICGVPLDAGYFDVADIMEAPQNPGEERELARYALHPQYCGILLYFAQYAEPAQYVEPEETQSQEKKIFKTQEKKIFKTPGYEWVILCNNQPRDPYLPTDVIRNPWGENAFPVHLRLEEGCLLRFVVRQVAPAAKETKLSKVGGRLVGRYWYNAIYGGVPNRL
jgi:hypothetical protein